MDKEEVHSRVGQEIRSCHPYAYRSGQWALIKGVSTQADGKDMWLLEWPDGMTDVWVPWDEVAEYEFRSTDPLVRLLDEELGSQYLAEHLAEVLREAGYNKVELQCLCGIMLRDNNVICRLHPEVQVRSFNQRMDFEQAFDASIKKDKEK